MPHTPPRPPLLRRRRHDLLALALVLLVALLPRIVELGADPPARVLGAFLSDEGWWAQNARQRVLFGEWVMDELRDLDQVAYIRIASVYRGFQDVNAFREEIERLQQASDVADSK